jgi:hypothetical protein
MNEPNPNAPVRAIQQRGHLGRIAINKGAIAENVMLWDRWKDGLWTRIWLFTDVYL